MDARDYDFVSVWRVPVGTQAAWRIVTDALSREGAPRWWTQVRVGPVPRRIAAGEQFGLDVRSPLGYRLRVRLQITEITAGRGLVVESAGDLAGTGTLQVRPVGTGAELVLRWRVRTMKPWMRLIAPVARPVFSWAHGRVMRAGERGLLRHIAEAGRSGGAGAVGV